MAATMTELFAASKIKIERARCHLAELEAVSERHFTENPPIAEFTEATENQNARLHVKCKPPPECFGAIVGDVIHNLRAALDLMAVKLVSLKTDNTKNVYFPFCEVETDLDLMIKKRNFHKAGPEAVAVLKSLQPFKGGNLALRAIHDLDIQDKHHSLIPNAAMMTTPQVFADTSVWPPVVRLVEGSAPVIGVTFPSDSPLRDSEIIPTLHEMVKLVESILETFDAIPRTNGT